MGEGMFKNLKQLKIEAVKCYHVFNRKYLGNENLFL